MATPCSFDITSNVDLQEVDNALNQARKEVAQRYDFKGAKASIDFDPKESRLVLIADDEFKVNALWEIVQTRLVRRNVPVKNLTRGTMQPAANSTMRQEIMLQQGIPTEKARGHRQVSEGRQAQESSGGHSRGSAAGPRRHPRTTCRRRCECCASRTSASPCSSGTTAGSYFFFFSSQFTSISLPGFSCRIAFEILSVRASSGSSVS
jgi:uncharacterized protein YajQ (UPF0234 family)